MASLVISGDIQAPRAIPGEGELQPRQYPGDVEIPNRVFVKGFSRETTEEELKIFFEEFGIVRESKIVKDKTGISKGYAFITFDSQQVAEDVKQKEVVKYNQKDLVLGPARIRKKRPIFRARPDLWPGTPVAGNMIQQVPVYYQVSPDGAWYFQQPMQSPSNTQMAISLVPTTSQVPYLANQSTYPTQQQLQLQQLQLQTQLAATHLGQNVYPTVTQASPAGPTYPMSKSYLFFQKFHRCEKPFSDSAAAVTSGVSFKNQ